VGGTGERDGGDRACGVWATWAPEDRYEMRGYERFVGLHETVNGSGWPISLGRESAMKVSGLPGECSGPDPVCDRGRPPADACSASPRLDLGVRGHVEASDLGLVHVGLDGARRELPVGVVAHVGLPEQAMLAATRVSAARWQPVVSALRDYELGRSALVRADYRNALTALTR
jgi:hypothetical protein